MYFSEFSEGNRRQNHSSSGNYLHSALKMLNTKNEYTQRYSISFYKVKPSNR